MLKSFLFILTSFFLFTSCDNIQEHPRKEVSVKRSKIIASPIERNFNIDNKEEEIIKKYISQNPNLHFRKNSDSFWYTYRNRNVKDSITPTSNDSLVYTYSILNFNKDTIYSEEMIGKKSYIVDNQEILPIFKYTLELMKKGESITVLTPSSLAYSYLGDNDKITKNQPLILNIELIDLINKQ